MELNSNKELTPVLYGEISVKILHFKVEHPNNECFRIHWHDRMEILIIDSGELKLTLGEISKIAKKGDIVIINPKEVHKAISGENGAEYFVLMFDIEKFDNHSLAFEKYLRPILQGQIVFQNIVNEPDIYKIAKKITFLNSNKNANNPLQTIGMVYNLLGAFYTHKLDIRKTTSAPTDKLDAVKKYINDNFDLKISTKSLSQKFGYNEAYFCRIFKINTGISVMKYINILRLQHAEKLLLKSDFTVTEIALKSGFSDVFYFSHCFKEQYGLSPVVYKSKTSFHN